MLDTAIAQLRCAASLVFGWPFPSWALDCLIAAARDTRREFGPLPATSAQAVSGPILDEETRQTMQLRRFRTQATRGARETAFYAALFARSGLNPARLGHADIGRIPPTAKEDVRDDPDAFVRRSARPTLRTTTTGTTGVPATVSFSAHELGTTAALAALSYLIHGQITPEDLVQINTSGRATLGNTCFAHACTRIGASWAFAGLVDPEHTLTLLAHRHRLPGKKPRVSVLHTYASYLGELVTRGLQRGYRPADFGLERIIVGGEIVTDGLLSRARLLFGAVEFLQGYAMTETWPCIGTRCAEGHLHVEASQGLVEVLALETGTPARPGEAGTLVVTPFAPYRDATIILRYDTEDTVRALVEPPRCELRHMPATSDLLGKRRLAVRHETGWTFPREVLEALEAVEAVPLPARYGFWAVPGGVAVEVVAPSTQATRRQVEALLDAHGVPVHQLYLVPDPAHLQQPRPLRCDLREQLFTPRPPSSLDTGT